MNKIEELFENNNDLYTSYSVKNKEGIYKKVVSSEKAAEITKDIAIKFGIFWGNHLYSKKLKYQGKTNYEIFEEFLKTL